MNGFLGVWLTNGLHALVPLIGMVIIALRLRGAPRTLGLIGCGPLILAACVDRSSGPSAPPPTWTYGPYHPPGPVS